MRTSKEMSLPTESAGTRCRRGDADGLRDRRQEATAADHAPPDAEKDQQDEGHRQRDEPGDAQGEQGEGHNRDRRREQVGDEHPCGLHDGTLPGRISCPQINAGRELDWFPDAGRRFRRPSPPRCHQTSGDETTTDVLVLEWPGPSRSGPARQQRGPRPDRWSTRRRRNVPAIIDTAAAIAPVPPASSTALELGAEAATRRRDRTIETVPSSMPKTMDPTEARKDRRSARPTSVAGAYPFRSRALACGRGTGPGGVPVPGFLGGGVGHRGIPPPGQTFIRKGPWQQRGQQPRRWARHQ